MLVLIVDTHPSVVSAGPPWATQVSMWARTAGIRPAVAHIGPAVPASTSWRLPDFAISWIIISQQLISGRRRLTQLDEEHACDAPDLHSAPRQLHEGDGCECWSGFQVGESSATPSNATPLCAVAHCPTRDLSCDRTDLVDRVLALRLRGLGRRHWL